MVKNMSGFVPTGYRILVKMDKVEERTSGGIFKPDSLVEKEEFAEGRGTLIAVGEKAFSIGTPNTEEFYLDKDRPVPGDRILMTSYEGVKYEGVDGEEYRVADSRSVLGIIKQEAESE